MMHDALTEIKNLLGAGAFMDDASSMTPYVTSMRNRHRCESSLVALPSSTEQVAALVKICARHCLPMVPQGGNTGLVDGGIPSPEGHEIIVNLSRMNKIRDIDAVGSIVTAEAGVILQNLQNAAADAGFLFPLSMASQGSMQIGGAISTNAGGTAVLRYGNTRQLVLGLEVVLPDGSVMSNLRKLVKDNSGYNLNQFFIGAEGTLGIVTAATLRLYPSLRQKLTAMVALPDVDTALELYVAFRRPCAEYLTAFEIMSQVALQLVVKHIPDARMPRNDNAPFYVLIELGASSPTAPLAELFENVVVPALEQGKIQDAVIAASDNQAKQFWHLREHIPDALRKQSSRIHFDIALPLAALPEFMATAERAIHDATPDITLMPFGHIGDGNLHYNMYATLRRSPAAFAAIKEQIQDIVFTAVERYQGSISAEHGIGVERKAMLAKVKSPAELNLMRAIKRALDPDNIMNPGKVFD